MKKIVCTMKDWELCVVSVSANMKFLLLLYILSPSNVTRHLTCFPLFFQIIVRLLWSIKTHYFLTPSMYNLLPSKNGFKPLNRGLPRFSFFSFNAVSFGMVDTLLPPDKLMLYLRIKHQNACAKSHSPLKL
jgi:hypothetical protein